jgi:hypothetical protein
MFHKETSMLWSFIRNIFKPSLSTELRQIAEASQRQRDAGHAAAKRSANDAAKRKAQELKKFRLKCNAALDEPGFYAMIRDSLKLNAATDPRAKGWSYTDVIISLLARQGCNVIGVDEQRVAIRESIKLINKHFRWKGIRAEEYDYTDRYDYHTTGMSGGHDSVEVGIIETTETERIGIIIYR